MIWTTLAGLMWAGLVLVTGIQLAKCIRLVPNRREYVVERFGKYKETLGPGLHVLLPFFDKVAFVRDLREESIEVPPQEAFTADNVRVEVDGVIYISVMDTYNASYGITDYRYAASTLAQTTTRSVIGTLELDRTFEEREAINARVVHTLEEVSEAWGIKVHRYEVKNIVPPPSVRDAMERQMGAERDRRALIARAEGEMQARVNGSEGKRAELINASEGEMQRRINEAGGKVAEILALATATGESIEKVGYELAQPGGSEAIKLQLSKRFLEKLQALGHKGTKVVLPADLSRLDQLLAAVGLETEGSISVPKNEMEAAQRQPPPKSRSLTVDVTALNTPVFPAGDRVPPIGAHDAATVLQPPRDTD
jgi:regulator of protease activity HflC (stomatin/prohibitin superfamily)